MDSVTIWVNSLWAEFQTLSPAAQASWCFGALAVVGPSLYWFVRLFTRRPKVEPSKLAAPDVMDRLIRLVADGKASVDQAADLARIMMAQTITPAEPAFALAMASSGPGAHTGPQSVSPAATGDGENRRNFVKVVQSLATSSSADERAVVLKYAKGDISAAFAALEKRALSAGAKGAAVWRELAALARPRDPERAMRALEQATALEPNDPESQAYLAELLAAAGLGEAAVARGLKAREFSNTPLQHCLANRALSLGYGANADTARAREAADGAVAQGRIAATADPASVEAARALARAFSTTSIYAAEQGDVLAARASAESAADILRAVLADDSGDAEAAVDLCAAYRRLSMLVWRAGDLASSIAYLNNARELASRYQTSDSTDLAVAREGMLATSLLAWRTNDAEDEDKALALVDETIAQSERLLALDPKSAVVGDNLNWAHILRARLLSGRGESAAALSIVERAATLARARAATGDVAAKEALANVLWELAQQRINTGDVAGAQSLYEECRVQAQAASAADPTNVGRLDRLATCYSGLRYIADFRGDWAELDRNMTEAIAVARRVLTLDPSFGYREKLASLLNSAAICESRAGRSSSALALGVETHDIYEALLAVQPRSPSAIVNTITAKIDLAGTWLWLRDLSRADALLAQAVDRSAKAMVAFPALRSVVDAAFAVKERIAIMRTEEGRYEEAADLRCEVAAEYAARVAKDETNQDRVRGASSCACTASAALADAGHFARAEEEARRALDWARMLKEPNLPANRHATIAALQALAPRLKERGDPSAERLYAEAASLSQSIEINPRHTFPRDAFQSAISKCEARAQAKDFAAAQDALSKARTLVAETFVGREDHPLRPHWDMQVLLAEGTLWGNEGKVEQFLARQEEVIAMSRAEVARNPRSATARVALIERMLAARRAIGVRNKSREFELVREALDLAEGLARLSPNALTPGNRAANCREQVAELLITQGQLAEARPYVERTLAYREEQVQKQPDQRTLRLHLANAYRTQSSVVSSMGQFAQALSLQRKASEISLALADSEPDPLVAARHRDTVENGLSCALFAAGELDEGELVASAAVARLRKMAETASESDQQDLRFTIISHEIRSHECRGNFSALVPLYQELAVILNDRFDNYSDPVMRDYYLTLYSENFISAAAAANRIDLAKERLARWAPAISSYADANPSPPARLALACVEQARAEIALAEGRLEDAVRDCDAALQKFSSVVAEAPDDVSVVTCEAEVVCMRAAALGDAASKANASQHWQSLKDRCGGVIKPYTSSIMADRKVSSWAL